MKQVPLAIEQLRDAVLRMPANGLSASRASALANLSKHGLPTLRHEDWKYTNLEPVTDISNRWLAAGASNSKSNSSSKAIATITSSIDANWIVIANGEIDVSQFAESDDITFELFSESTVPELSNKPLADLNAALLSDGLRVRIGAATEKPLGLLVIDEAVSTPTVSQSRIDIDIAAGCDAEIIEYHSSAGADDCYCNSVVTLAVGESSSANFVRIQDRGLHHTQTSRLSVDMGFHSNLQMAAFDLGGKLVRNDVEINLNECGANAMFDGLFLAGNGQHIDNHTRVDHRVGPASSSQEYRGILSGRCQCVWNGKAIVYKGADGTDANQANHNLLLSEKAEIDTKPELEIYADEVKCSHGTTVGQLDESALYYLRTRGLSKRKATEILTHAFAADLVTRTPITSSVAIIRGLVEKRLAELIQDETT